jgi:Kdo2-lipid IVA lauroyltransferase/acyltransferase
MSMPVLLNFQASIIVKRQRNYYTDTFLNKYRSQYGNRIVYTKDSVRETLRVLRDNGVVAIIADQSGPKDSIYVPFFGRSVATFGGPALFALRTGASIIMILSIRREDGTYEAVFEEVLQDGLNGSEAGPGTRAHRPSYCRSGKIYQAISASLALAAPEMETRAG